MKNIIQEYNKIKEDRDVVLADIDEIQDEIEKMVNSTITLIDVNTYMAISTPIAKVNRYNLRRHDSHNDYRHAFAAYA